MPITRSQSVGADNAANLEEVETSATSGSGEVRELRGQLAALTDMVAQQTESARRQEARMKRLEDLLLQQAKARETQAPTLPAPEEAIVALPAQVPRAGAAFPVTAVGEEGDRLMERLNEFRRCSPRIFDGEKVDHWIVEKWLMHMEKLFRDTFVEERDRVWLATHHLDGEAYRWCVKRRLEQDLRNLRQGDRTVAEYEREFSRLLHCVPFVVRDDEDKARIFESGLRRSIFRFVQSSNLQTYREVVNRALIVESGAADVQERREALDNGKGKRPTAEGASQTHSRRPPKHPRSQQRRRGSATHRGGSDRRRPSQCVICGGPHYLPQCPQRAGRCYQCGQEGHIRT
uniref:Retrotransposon gag domain-containing protein n=1 Tax=Ananas comosus var. bracteatus TaxID=296719 RepID=A0A6V7NT06_ANACO|nr:unnamed protein product [Ananas comosus var. bracteatus]